MKCGCKHWSPSASRHWGNCAMNLYGGKPSLGTCQICPQYDGSPRGVGDVIAKVTRAVGIKPCGGCKERQAKLNQAMPFKDANLS